MVAATHGLSYQGTKPMSKKDKKAKEEPTPKCDEVAIEIKKRCTLGRLGFLVTEEDGCSIWRKPADDDSYKTSTLYNLSTKEIEWLYFTYAKARREVDAVIEKAKL